ncbi:MAG: sigma-54 dependent transcriptional regulator [Planctomycetota bacterium]|nr:sigma-54 dependent transcriptional regulator [Planctomycetota bacterium]
MSAPRILIIDDNAAIRDSMGDSLRLEGYEVEEASDGKIGLDRLQAESFGAVLLDIKMPRMDGIEVLQALGESGVRRSPIIMITAHGDVETAVECMTRGAFHFLLKPFETEVLIAVVEKAVEVQSLRNTVAEYRTESCRMLGESEGIQAIHATIQTVAPTQARVLILGENGTGKELAARSIHALSDRFEGPFVDVNCAAIPHDLIESELFGHMKGSFTGAGEDREGKFVQASGGTLFLDEIGDMSLDAQAKVLRVLEENEVRPVGGKEVVSVDARVVAATNKDLKEEVEEGRFREDLYFRLNVVPIRLPALRDRVDDVPRLTEAFCEQLCRQYGSKLKRFSTDALKALREHDWPGNVRELRNLVERLVILVSKEEITAEDIFLERRRTEDRSVDLFSQCETFEEFKATSERLFLQFKLEENGGNVKRTAEQLQMQRSNMYKKIEKYGLRS